MNFRNADILKSKQKEVQELLRDFIRIMGIDARNHFVKNFEKQGFDDDSVHAWQKRKITDEGRAILVKSGDLRRSIKVDKTSTDKVVISSDLPYARIHNEGLKGKAFGKHSFLMPKRRFMGFSKKLIRNLRNKLRSRINKIFGK
jgi:phage gpG-like protein